MLLHACCALGDRIYVVGGVSINSNTKLSSIETLDARKLLNGDANVNWELIP